jgi:phenylacetate-CoA ligase
VLTKDEVLAAGASAFGDVPGKTVAAHTSGTTGAGFRFDLTAEAVQEQWAVWWRYRRWHGIEIRTPCGVFAGRSVVPIADRSGPFWRIDAVSRRVLFSAYHLSPQTAPAYVDAVRRRKLPWLHGYPSFIALLAGFVLEQGLDPGPSVRWITTGAENLLPSQADAIEQAFGVRPTQHYGLGEAVANASQCPSGSLHLDEDFAAAELLPRDDGAFQLVGTALANSAMPLIRYDTGDVVADEGSCSCGRPGRVLTRIDGRSEDYVILRDGSLVGRLDHAFKDLMEIREAQIVQSVPGALTVRIVRRPGFSDTDEARLVDELRRRLGNDTEIAVEYVSTLPRSANGKLRFVVSEIARGA